MSARFGRRFAALLYDCLLITAFWLLLTALAQLATHGRAIVQETVGAWVYVYRAGLIATIFAYYSLSVQRVGHTLGMRAWRLRAQMPGGDLMTFARALSRCALGMLSWALCALGVLWLYADREGLAVQDRFSGTRLIRIRN